MVHFCTQWDQRWNEGKKRDLKKVLTSWRSWQLVLMIDCDEQTKYIYCWQLVLVIDCDELTKKNLFWRGTKHLIYEEYSKGIQNTGCFCARAVLLMTEMFPVLLARSDSWDYDQSTQTTYCNDIARKTLTLVTLLANVHNITNW